MNDAPTQTTRIHPRTRPARLTKEKTPTAVHQSHLSNHSGPHGQETEDTTMARADVELRPKLRPATRKTNGPYGEARSTRPETGQASTTRVGVFEVRNVQLLEIWNVQNMHLGPDTRQVPGHGRQVQGDCAGRGRQAWHQRPDRGGEKQKPCGESASCTRGGTRSWDGQGNNHKPDDRDIQKKGREEHKMKPADKQAEAARQALARTAAMMTRRRLDLEEAEKQ